MSDHVILWVLLKRVWKRSPSWLALEVVAVAAAVCAAATTRSPSRCLAGSWREAVSRPSNDGPAAGTTRHLRGGAQRFGTPILFLVQTALPLLPSRGPS